jgi:nitroimidazol reductase NimA-like FMN-containing flavoprotein (pyridoxamine 5'-phosphate oxidase superfamily)
MRRLDDEAVRSVLRENGSGVLALDDWNAPAPYSIPVAYGYDDDRDLFVVQLEGDETSHKKRCLQRNRNVSFTVYEEAAPGETWRSVVIEGELVPTEYEAAEPALAVLAANTADTPNPIRWGDSGTVDPYELEIAEWSGRAFDIA